MKRFVYHFYGAGGLENLFGSGFLKKQGTECRESQNIYRHYGAVLVLSGEAIHCDDTGKSSKIYPGCLIQRIPGKKQSLYIKDDGSWEEFYVCIGRDMYDAMVSMGLLNHQQEIFCPGLSHAIYEECCGLEDAMEFTHPAKMNQLLPRAISLILKLRCSNLEYDGGEISREDKCILDEACRLMKNHSACPESMRELSGSLGMGYEKFRKLFKEYIGLSPQNYVKEQRIIRAKQLLLHSEKTIKDIASDMGFCDQYAFSRQFRNETGMSPSQFRRVPVSESVKEKAVV